MEQVQSHYKSFADSETNNNYSEDEESSECHDGDSLPDNYSHHLDEDVQKLEKQLSYLRNGIIDNFNGLDSRFDSLEQACADLKYENSLSLRKIIREQVEKEEMKQKVLDITNYLEKYAREQDAKRIELQRQTDQLFQFSGLMINRIENLEKLYEGLNRGQRDGSERLTNLEIGMQMIERGHSLILHNFCQRDEGSAQEMFLVFAKNVLEMSIEDADIEAIYDFSKPVHPSIKASSPTRDLSRSILVTFTCYAIKARIYGAWLSYRTSDNVGNLAAQTGQGLSIQEYLDDVTEAVYSEALILKNKNEISDVWTIKGKVYVRDLEGVERKFKSTTVTRNNKKGYCFLM